MAVNLINEKSLNDYVFEIVYKSSDKSKMDIDNFKSMDSDYVIENKYKIAKALIYQWSKHRLRKYLMEKEGASYLKEVERDEKLPSWALDCIDDGKKVFSFEKDKINDSLKEDISFVSDFLYTKASDYIEFEYKKATQGDNNKKINLRPDFLKTVNEISDFEKALYASKKWHELLEQKSKNVKKDKEFTENSKIGTKTVMNFDNGMEVVKLLDKDALLFEGTVMGHCVGKGNYDDAVYDGSIQIYSLRGKDGEPHATFEVKDGKLEQCKGKGNKPPVSRYNNYVRDFIANQRIDISKSNDAKKMGIISNKGEYHNLYDMPDNFVFEGNIDVSDIGLEKLPDFSKIIVNGDFNCSLNPLQSLEGSPKKVMGSYSCSGTQVTSLKGVSNHIGRGLFCMASKLESLEHLPEFVTDINVSGNNLQSLKGCKDIVNGNFSCANNKLQTLEYGPRIVKGNFDCSGNNLENLKYSPKNVMGDYDCSKNGLETLQYVTDNVGRDFICSYNKLKDLSHSPMNVGASFYCLETGLESLKDAPKIIKGGFNCAGNNIKSLEFD